MDWFIIGLINVILFKHRCMSNSEMNIEIKNTEAPVREIPNQSVHIGFTEFIKVQALEEDGRIGDRQDYIKTSFTYDNASKVLYTNQSKYCIKTDGNNFVLKPAANSQENCVRFNFINTSHYECVQVNLNLPDSNMNYLTRKRDNKYYVSDNKDDCLKVKFIEAGDGTVYIGFIELIKVEPLSYTIKIGDKQDYVKTPFIYSNATKVIYTKGNEYCIKTDGDNIALKAATGSNRNCVQFNFKNTSDYECVQVNLNGENNNNHYLARNNEDEYILSSNKDVCLKVKFIEAGDQSVYIGFTELIKVQALEENGKLGDKKDFKKISFIYDSATKVLYAESNSYCIKEDSNTLVLKITGNLIENCVRFNFTNTLDYECVQVISKRSDINNYYLARRSNEEYYLSNNKDDCLKVKLIQTKDQSANIEFTELIKAELESLNIGDEQGYKKTSFIYSNAKNILYTQVIQYCMTLENDENKRLVLKAPTVSRGNCVQLNFTNTFDYECVQVRLNGDYNNIYYLRRESDDNYNLSTEKDNCLKVKFVKAEDVISTKEPTTLTKTSPTKDPTHSKLHSSFQLVTSTKETSPTSLQTTRIMTTKSSVMKGTTAIKDVISTIKPTKSTDFLPVTFAKVTVITTRIMATNVPTLSSVTNAITSIKDVISTIKPTKSTDFLPVTFAKVTLRTTRIMATNNPTLSSVTNEITSIKDDFGPWSPWSVCSASCKGYQKRERRCSRSCKSNSKVQSRFCGKVNCPIHGGFTEWTGWTECSSSCGGGRKQRKRTCNNPEPQYEGNQCVGKFIEESECNLQFCPQNASPGQWTEWSACNKPCNTGSYVRRRDCIKGLYGGLEYCEEPLVEEVACNQRTCPNTFASTELRFNLKYLPEYSAKGSKKWNEFQEDLKKQIKESFEDQFPNEMFDVDLVNLRNGSVIAKFKILFENLDSFQFLTLQESIETDRSISKLEIIEMISSYTIDLRVPSAPPSNITVVTLSGTSIHVSWLDVPLEHQNGNITGYILFYREKLDLSSNYSVLASDGYELTLTGLNPATLYSFRLLAYTSKGNGIASPEMLRSTFEMLPSAEPKQVNASTLGAFGMYLEWKGVSLSDMNGIPLGYNITFFGNKKLSFISVSFTETAIVLEHLTPDTNYVFEVCPFNNVGQGPCQKAINQTLPTAPTAPPQNVTVSEIMTHNYLTLIWSSPPEERIHGDLTAYNITYQAIQNGETLYLNPKLFYTTTHPSVTTITIKGLNGNTKYLFSIAAVNIHGVGVATSVYGKTCNCPEVVSSAFYTVRPYVFYRDEDYETLHGVYPRLIENMITVACGLCHRPSGSLYTTVDKHRDGRNASSLKTSLENVLNEIDDYTDLVFPVVSHASTRIYMGYPFVNVINHPGVVFITKEESINEIVVEMIKRVMGVVPVLGLNVLMLVIAGFIIWILERIWNNVKQSDFSKKLWKGVGEGIYWAFITQGTHGYGDFSPVTFASRSFTVLWILISLILSSIIVGFIVSVFTTINGSPGVTIYGSKIGAINGSLEQNFGVLRNGKIRFEAEYLSVNRLAEDLLDDKIQGILLDAYTAGATKEALNHPQLRPTAVYEYSKAYGLVLSGDLRYIGDEIRDYVKVNEKYILEIIQNNTERMEPREKKLFKSVFDPSSTVLATALSWLFGIYIFLFFIGVSFHCIRFAKKKSKVARVPTSGEQWYENIKIVGNSLFDFVTSKKAQIVALEKKHYLQCKLLYKDRGQSSLREPEPVRRRQRKPKPKNFVIVHTDGDHPYNILNQSLSVEECSPKSIEFPSSIEESFSINVPNSIEIVSSTEISRSIEVLLLHSTRSRRQSTSTNITETTFTEVVSFKGTEDGKC